MNISTILGIIVGLLVVGSAIVSSTGNLAVFWNPDGLAVVLGGVLAATFVCYPMKDVMRLFSSALKVMKREHLPIEVYIESLVYLAKQAMSKSALKLEKEVDQVDNQFIKDGLRMVVDQYPPEKLRHIMEISIENSVDRDKAEAEIFRTMARFSPAFGMVGTLIGLIVTFQNLQSEPSIIGSSIAVAMMSTFYGLLAANLIFSPFAIKMERRADDREVLMRVIMEGLIMVSKNTPPQYVRDELKAFIPSNKWSEHKLKRDRATKKTNRKEKGVENDTGKKTAEAN